jgi:hypothetical protein
MLALVLGGLRSDECLTSIIPSANVASFELLLQEQITFMCPNFAVPHGFSPKCKSFAQMGNSKITMLAGRNVNSTIRFHFIRTTDTRSGRGRRIADGISNCK